MEAILCDYFGTEININQIIAISQSSRHLNTSSFMVIANQSLSIFSRWKKMIILSVIALH
jgi:hypothetical protein